MPEKRPEEIENNFVCKSEDTQQMDTEQEDKQDEQEIVGDEGEEEEEENKEDSQTETDEPTNESAATSAHPSAISDGRGKKFASRCRLFIGNLINTDEEGFRKIFENYGDVTEVFLNKERGFGILKMDYRENAERAQLELDGSYQNGKQIRVRFATLGALKVSNLHPCVSNELLAKAFSMFGEVERAVVIVDERACPTGEGIVEFAHKKSAQAALNRIGSGLFLITSSPRPVLVESLEIKDDQHGYPEKVVPKVPSVFKEREQKPRFAKIGTMEFNYASRWKELLITEKQQKEQLDKTLSSARERMQLEMQNMLQDKQTLLLRQDLLRCEDALRRMEQERNKSLDLITKRQEELVRMRHKDGNLVLPGKMMPGGPMRQMFNTPPPNISGSHLGTMGMKSGLGMGGMMGAGMLGAMPSKYDKINLGSKIFGNRNNSSGMSGGDSSLMGVSEMSSYSTGSRSSMLSNRQMHDSGDYEDGNNWRDSGYGNRDDYMDQDSEDGGNDPKRRRNY